VTGTFSNFLWFTTSMSNIPLPARFLILVLLLTGLQPANLLADENGDIETEGFVVSLTTEQQRLAGIRISHPQPASFTPVEPVPARVIDPLPLLRDAGHWHRLSMETETARRLLAIASQSRTRLRSLGNSVRQEKLNEAESNWISAKARVDELTAQQQILRNSIRLTWGPKLGHWVETLDPTLEALGKGKTRLLTLVFPHRSPSVFTHQAILMQSEGKALPLQPLSPAPQDDSILPGWSYFYLARTPDLPIGMRLTAWLSESQPAIPIPAEAVVWHGGRPWIYVQTDAHSFQRKVLADYHQTAHTWWTHTGLMANDGIVISGAQILLSEEFRAQVPEENDDD